MFNITIRNLEGETSLFHPNYVNFNVGVKHIGASSGKLEKVPLWKWIGICQKIHPDINDIEASIEVTYTKGLF